MSSFFNLRRLLYFDCKHQDIRLRVVKGDVRSRGVRQIVFAVRQGAVPAQKDDHFLRNLLSASFASAET